MKTLQLIQVGVATLALAAIMQTRAESETPSTDGISVRQYPSIQAAIDANPGRMLLVPSGDYEISQPLRLSAPGTGLFGQGRIIQTDPKCAILRIDKGSHNVVQGLVLTRPEGRMETDESGIAAEDCEFLELDGLRVLDNRGPGGSIRVANCRNVTIRNCTILNYKGFTIDDRTGSALMGYAFRAIDGTGIKVFYSEGTVIQGNRIIESRLLPTKELRNRHKLGEVTVVPEVEGPLTPKDIARTRYTTNWHQGSGLIVGGLGKSRFNLVTGNYIENAAQGMDIHADYVVISNNIVNHAMMGMKAMHGSKHVLIIGNQFTHVDLWGVMLMPGAASHAAGVASRAPNAAKEANRALAANSDGQHIIANNIFSDFGYGNDYWNRQEGRANDGPVSDVIALLGGQLPENPPLRNVVITGNVVYNSGTEPPLVDGRPTVQPARYRYALYIERDKQPIPEGVRVSNNLLDPGTNGISNIEITP